MAQGKGQVYSIGYATRSVEQFVEVCRRHDIGFVIDVRSQPYSRYRPEFGRDALALALPDRGIRYVFLGQQLGGKLEDPDCLRPDGSADYAVRALQQDFRAGLSRLVKAVDLGHKVVLMCGEMRHVGCHRAKLIGPALLEHDIDIAHINAEDEIEWQSNVVPEAQQMMLQV